MAKPAQVYQIKVTLNGSKPPIWRRLLVSSETTLDQLHQIIQEAMPWYDSHLHQFTIGDERYSVPYEPGMLEELDMRDEYRIPLSEVVAGEGFHFDYEYDFGDSWEHRILVEKILPPKPDQQLPVCIKGKRACPPEDCGGIWSYDNFLEALGDPEHPVHESYTEWIGDESFDPEAFDLDEINARLRDLR